LSLRYPDGACAGTHAAALPGRLGVVQRRAVWQGSGLLYKHHEGG